MTSEDGLLLYQFALIAALGYIVLVWCTYYDLMMEGECDVESRLDARDGGVGGECRNLTTGGDRDHLVG